MQSDYRFTGELDSKVIMAIITKDYGYNQH